MIDIDSIIKSLENIEDKDVLGLKYSSVKLEDNNISIDVNLLIKNGLDVEIDDLETSNEPQDITSVRERLKNSK